MMRRSDWYVAHKIWPGSSPEISRQPFGVGCSLVNIILGKFIVTSSTTAYTTTQGTDLPDPALDPGTLNLMRSRCDNSNDQTEEPSINMDYEGALERGFGTDYYKNLVQGKGILHADQHLMVCEEAANLVASRGREGFGHSNSIGIAMKCVEGIVCLADSKVTLAGDPNFSETISKLHKVGDNVVLITLGNAYRCHLLLEYLWEAIEIRVAATPVKPPLTLYQIAVFCALFFERTNDRHNRGAFSRVIICGLDPGKKIYNVQSANTDIEEADNYVMAGSGSVDLSPMGRFRISSNTTLFTMVEAMEECTNAALSAIELHPQTCGKPVMIGEAISGSPLCNRASHTSANVALLHRGLH
ncbi:hypothetical protein OROMI_020088 [Orobanche minor]